MPVTIYVMNIVQCYNKSVGNSRKVYYPHTGLDHFQVGRNRTVDIQLMNHVLAKHWQSKQPKKPYKKKVVIYE